MQNKSIRDYTMDDVVFVRAKRSTFIDRTDQQFGSWTVLGYAGDLHWWCRCDCGTIRKHETKAIKKNHSLACSRCTSDGSDAVSNLGVRLHRIWLHMRERCQNPNCKSYKDYGARGIRVCPQWDESFTAFAKWAHANGYRDDLTIERMDFNGGYHPGNCTWIPNVEQSKNRRGLRVLGEGEDAAYMAEYARRSDIPYITLRDRLRRGWSLEKAATMPVRAMKKAAEWNRRPQTAKSRAQTDGTR